MLDSFTTRATLAVGGKRYQIYSLARLGERFDLSRLPYSLKILLENLLRHEDGVNVTTKEIEALASWDAATVSATERVQLPSTICPQRAHHQVRVEIRRHGCFKQRIKSSLQSLSISI